MKKYIVFLLSLVSAISLSACSSAKDNAEEFSPDTVQLEQWEHSGTSVLTSSIAIDEAETVKKLWSGYQELEFDSGTVQEEKIAHLPSIVVIFKDSKSKESEQFTVYETGMGTVCKLEADPATLYVVDDNFTIYDHFQSYIQTDKAE